MSTIMSSEPLEGQAQGEYSEKDTTENLEEKKDEENIAEVLANLGTEETKMGETHKEDESEKISDQAEEPASVTGITKEGQTSDTVESEVEVLAVRGRLKKASGEAIEVPKEETVTTKKREHATTPRITRSKRKELDEAVEAALEASKRKSKKSKKHVATKRVAPSPVTIKNVSPSKEKRKGKGKDDSQEDYLHKEPESPTRSIEEPEPISAQEMIEGQEYFYTPTITQARQDSFAMRIIIPGKVISGVGDEAMTELMKLVKLQGWEKLMVRKEQPRKLAKKELVDFYVYGFGGPDHIRSSVRGLIIDLNPSKLGNLLEVPSYGWNEFAKGEWPELHGLAEPLEIVRRFAQDGTIQRPRSVQLKELSPLHKYLYTMVIRMLLPRNQRRTEASYMDLAVMELMIRGEQINLPGLMLRHIYRVVSNEDPSAKQALGYGFWLGDVFERLGASISNWTYEQAKDRLGEIDEQQEPPSDKKESGLVQRLRLVMAQKDEIIANKDKEIAALKQVNETALKELRGQLETEQEQQKKMLDEVRAQLAEKNVEIERERRFSNLLSARLDEIETKAATSVTPSSIPTLVPSDPASTASLNEPSA